MLLCALAEGYKFAEDKQGWYIAGALPKRRITISPGLAGLLHSLFNKEEVKLDQKTQKNLLYLAAKGYINIKFEAAELNNAILPLVSVIIPVKNRPQDLRQCLDSLKKTDWPQDKLQIIVVDDGSADNTPQVAEDAGAMLIRNEISEGPASARNRGAANSRGDILAFIDSDCLASVSWLRELTPWFSLSIVGALGGLVEGYYNQSSLDRYELACSSLSVGNRFIYETDPRNNFYVPSCNMLVRKRSFEQIGGFAPQMHLGEDVDLCWRLRNKEQALLFVPQGLVWHKHRTALLPMLKRKFAYGTSEAYLYKRNREKKKTMPMPIGPLIFFLGFAAALLGLWRFLWVVLPALSISAIGKHRLCRLIGQTVKMLEACLIAWRSSIAFCYYLCFHLIRYYLLIGGLLAFMWPRLSLLMLASLLFCSLVDWRIKKPGINYMVFLYYYFSEQLFYQAGVLWGGLKARYLRFYFLNPRFGSLKQSAVSITERGDNK